MTAYLSIENTLYTTLGTYFYNKAECLLDFLKFTLYTFVNPFYSVKYNTYSLFSLISVTLYSILV